MTQSDKNRTLNRVKHEEKTQHQKDVSQETTKQEEMD